MKQKAWAHFLKMLYTTLLYVMQPLVLLHLLFRSYRAPAYRHRWSERYGFCKGKIAPGGILLHSVSVGETITVIPLVRILHHRYPSTPITVTTITPTGSERVVSTFGKDIHHVYLPYDLPCSMKSFLNNVRPKLVIIMETELWPNMISILHQRKIPLVIVNARLSERSAKGYSKLSKFTRHLLNKITLIAAQNEEDAARFASLGLKRNHLAITGNLKFDCFIAPELAARTETLRHQLAPHRQIWIAASTHNGEESIILQAHRKLLRTFPNLLLILSPRHPERFKNVCNMVRKAGFSFALRSDGSNVVSNDIQVIVGDTMGELTLLYGISDLAFVGGSLVKKGGHNPLEPAAHGIPVLMGHHTFNFKDICNKLHQANGLITVSDVNSVVEKVSNLLINKECRLNYGYRAIEVLHQNQGALSRLLKLLRPYLSFQEPAGTVNANASICRNDH